MSETTKIIIRRDHEFRDALRGYQIFIDDKKISFIARGEEKEFQISPGKHRIYAKIDWCKSNEIEFETINGQEIRFICGSNLKGWRLFFAFLYIIFWRDEYLYIKIEKR
jgi:hypothetical protein